MTIALSAIRSCSPLAYSALLSLEKLKGQHLVGALLAVSSLIKRPTYMDNSILLEMVLIRLEKSLDALVAIKRLLPEEFHDWRLHGLEASETYTNIAATVDTALGKNNDKLDCRLN